MERHALLASLASCDDGKRARLIHRGFSSGCLVHDGPQLCQTRAVTSLVYGPQEVSHCWRFHWSDSINNWSIYEVSPPGATRTAICMRGYIQLL